MIKVTENSIIIDRAALFAWVTGEVNRVPAGTDSVGPTIAGGDIPGDDVAVSGSPEPTSEPQTSAADVSKGVDLFEEKNDIGGALQDAPNGSKKIQEMKTWMKDNNFSYRNFCLFLFELKEIAGWPLSKPLIGLTQKKEPSLFQVATRYYSFWKSQQNVVADDYKEFLREQVKALGFTIESACEILDGEVIDPSELPKGTEVAV
jgi:hypothetical protein